LDIPGKGSLRPREKSLADRGRGGRRGGRCDRRRDRLLGWRRERGAGPLLLLLLLSFFLLLFLFLLRDCDHRVEGRKVGNALEPDRDDEHHRADFAADPDHDGRDSASAGPAQPSP
jgi:hypothetical protein